MRSFNPRSLNPSFLNSCFTAGELATIYILDNLCILAAVYLSNLREAISKKISFCLEKVQMTVIPTHLYFWNTSRNFLKILFYNNKSSSKCFDFCKLPQFFLYFSKMKEKKFLKIFGIWSYPSPYLKKFQTQA